MENCCGGSEVPYVYPLDHNGLFYGWCTLVVSASTSVRNLAESSVGGSMVVISVIIRMFNDWDNTQDFTEGSHGSWVDVIVDNVGLSVRTVYCACRFGRPPSCNIFHL